MKQTESPADYKYTAASHGAARIEAARSLGYAFAYGVPHTPHAQTTPPPLSLLPVWTFNPGLRSATESDLADEGVITCVSVLCQGMLGGNLQCVSSSAGLPPLWTDCVAKGTVARMALAPLSLRLNSLLSFSSHPMCLFTVILPPHIIWMMPPQEERTWPLHL